jgi:bifunctional NMN adenylyltransferase/nudix hydrolase
MSSATPAAASVLIGRFQPFHLGHLALLRAALAGADHAVLVLGSAQSAPSPKNPWTVAERHHLILAALSESDRARLSVVAVRDYYDEARWAAAVTFEVSEALARAGHGHASVRLVGHGKDASSGYLRAFPLWIPHELPRQAAVDAVQLRQALWQPPAAAQHALAALAPLMPATTFTFLQAWLGSSAHAALCEEQAALEAHRAAWREAPYPPVFVTVDTLVTCQHHALLIQRGRAPGKGRFALPGGYVEQQESLSQGALRELREETGLAVTAPTTRLRGQAVFDHPQRSLLGRVITHVWHYEVAAASLPPVGGADDAASARWVAFADLPGLEDRLHDDHFMILDHFLGLLPR